MQQELQFDYKLHFVPRQVAQFLSDIGGVFGLWIGASILSLCEVCDVLVSICRACCERSKGSSHSRRSEDAVFDSRGLGASHFGTGVRSRPGQYDEEWGSPPPF